MACELWEIVGKVCQSLRTPHAVQHVHAKFAVPFPRQRLQPATQPAVIAHGLTKPRHGHADVHRVVRHALLQGLHVPPKGSPLLEFLQDTTLDSTLDASV